MSSNQQALLCAKPPAWNGLLNNLISYYKLDDNANDSDWSNWWTASNMSWVSAKINNWWDFDGSSSYISISDSASLWSLSNISISFWMKTDSTTQDCILITKDSVTKRDWTINCWPDWKLYLFFFTTNSVYSFSYSTSAVVSSTSTRYHFVVTRNSSWVIALYKDWSSVSLTAPNTSTWSLNDTDTPVYFWKREYAPARWRYNWKLDEIWIWWSVLTSTEVWYLYNSWSWLSYDSFTS